jgi:hypothetical protein
MGHGTSLYHSFKIWLEVYLPIDRDFLHFVIGAVLVLGAVVITHNSKRTKPFFWAFLAACALGVAMEVLDMRDDVRTLGIWRWGASLLDIARTISVPLLVWLLALIFKGKTP